nr:hypothetical protein [Tanacetum cinerariifolium]
GRKNSLTAGMSRQYTSGPSGTSRKQRVIVCYNCKGEGHMSKQYTKPKRKRDEAWFKDKLLLVQAQANGQVLHEEELEFLADPGIAETQSTSMPPPTILLIKPMIWMLDICERKPRKGQIRSKPDKNGKRGEVRKSQKQL